MDLSFLPLIVGFVAGMVCGVLVGALWAAMLVSLAVVSKRLARLAPPADVPPEGEPTFREGEDTR